MKILFFSSLYYPDVAGGAELTMKIIVEGLKERQIDVVVASLSPQNHNLVIDEIDNYRVYRCPIYNVGSELFNNKLPKYKRLLWKLLDIYNYKAGVLARKLLNEEKPDIVFCHNLAGWSCSVWREVNKAGIPLVQVLHDLYLLCPRYMFKGGNSCQKRCLICKISRSCHKRMSSSVDAVVSISKYIDSIITVNSYFQNSIKKVIYNSRQMAIVRTVNKEIRNFGFIGTVMPHKGIELLVSAFSNIEITASLLIAGPCDSMYRSKLDKISQNDERIEYLGVVKSESFFQKIDVLIVPSLWDEPLGMVAVEALIRSIPVITTGYGGLSEIVKDKVNGLLFDPKIPYDLENKIKQIYTDKLLFQRLCSNAVESVSVFANSKRQIDEYYSLIKELVI